MSLLINPGSRIVPSGTGWTNTVEGARRQAERWLSEIHREGSAGGMEDVVLLDGATPDESGTRWTFQFQHPATNKIVELETHGIDDLDAYLKDAIFDPRVYWNGGSSSTPCLENWLTPGFEVVRSIRPIASGVAQ
jgi:hypothetical protein